MRHEPFYLTYGREVTLLIKLTLPGTHYDSEMSVEDSLPMRIFTLVDRLPQTLKKAKQAIDLTQISVEKRHDSTLKGVQDIPDRGKSMATRYSTKRASLDWSVLYSQRSHVQCLSIATP